MTHFEQLQNSNNKFQSKQSFQSRQGDWICIRCNNLNFSFRKKCNRCKVQTREQNDINLMQVYHYYEQFYRPFDESQYNQPKKDYTLSQNRNLQNGQISSEKYSLNNQFAFTDQFEQNTVQINLPSVSPIVKRYNKQKTTPKTQPSEDISSQDQSSSSSSCSKQFLNEYCWKNILIDDDSESELELKDCDDFWDSQIQKIVQNIVL